MESKESAEVTVKVAFQRAAKQLLVYLRNLITPQAFHNKAQGRDQRERTLGREAFTWIP